MRAQQRPARFLVQAAGKLPDSSSHKPNSKIFAGIRLTCINVVRPPCAICLLSPPKEEQVRHLIIVAHPNTKSFNHAVVATYVAALQQRKHRVQCRDLYAANFNPVMSAGDLEALGHGRASKDRPRSVAPTC